MSEGFSTNPTDTLYGGQAWTPLTCPAWRRSIALALTPHPLDRRWGSNPKARGRRAGRHDAVGLNKHPFSDQS